MSPSQSTGDTLDSVAERASKRPYWRRQPSGYIFLAPALVVLGFFSLYPMVYSVVLSLFDWNWGTRLNFVGVKNYADLLTGQEFRKVLGQTFYFAIGAVAFELTIGLGLAVVANQLKFGASVVRTLLLTPLMISGIVVALMWKVMLDPMLGIVNYLFSLVGLPVLGFLGSQSTAMPTIIAIDTWWQTSFVFIILLAGLQSLPKEPQEAAEIDGASPWQAFRFVTLPMLSPVIFTVLIFRTIDTLKVFDIIFGTTGGGPQLSTEVIQTLTYRQAFSYQQISEAMTIMVIFSVLIAVICILYLWLQKRFEAPDSRNPE